MSLKTVKQIKEKIKNECYDSGHINSWFYNNHLLAVEKYANFLLKKLPKANSEIVLLGVWLHDAQKVRGTKGDHQKAGAIEARKIMLEYDYSPDMIKKVQNIILTHSCGSSRPDTLEGKILATADAMSHYVNDFYLQIAIRERRSLADFKLWALEKLNRDFNKKMFFPFAKKEIKERHAILMKLFTMK
ncbi:MAG: HD domain-containing protein [Patescibacteria group bacterium]|jgi:HD superfamily phosphodiesterase